jgi:uncharacterized protein YkwD
MKRFYQIVILIFFVLSLLIAKDDVFRVVGNVSSYFDKNIGSPIIELAKKEVALPGKVDTPGPLRVVSNILSTNNIKLSKDDVIVLTNKYRKDNGNLKPLVENQKLDLSAEKKLQDMFANQYFEHQSPGGKGVGDLGDEVGYKYILIGENLAMGNFKDDASLMGAWEASEGHRANILNIHYTDIGVAVGKGKFEGKDIWMAVQHFGEPRSICPAIDQILYGKIAINQNKISEMEADLTTRRDMINKGVVYQGNTPYEQVDIYNSLIIPYNNLINITKQEIDTYNNQINNFNTCLLANQ